MGCNDQCLKFKFEKPKDSMDWYGAGASRCDRCYLFISYEGMFCPCCGKRLRKTPRSKKGKGIKEKKDLLRI